MVKLKRLLQLIASSYLVRIVIIVVLEVFGFLERVMSVLKYRALVLNVSNSLCHYSVEIKYGSNIHVGRNSRIGPNCTLGGKGGIIIGDNVVLSKSVTLETAGLDRSEGPPYYKHNAKQIIIDDNVWIGTGVIVLGGVKIGKNALIGAGTVVTKNVEENEILVGVSNRKLRKN